MIRRIFVVLWVLGLSSTAWAAPAWQSCKDSKAWKAADANGDYPYAIFFHTDNEESRDARKKLSASDVDAALKDTTCFSIQLSAKGADEFMKSTKLGVSSPPAFFVVSTATKYERIDLAQEPAEIAEALKPLKMTAEEVLALYSSGQAKPVSVESDEGWSLTLPPHWTKGEDANLYVGPFEENTFPDNVNVVKTPPKRPPAPTKEVREGVQKQIQASLDTYKLRTVSSQKYGKNEALLIDGQFVTDGRNVSMYQAVFNGLVVTCTIDSAREESVWPQCQQIFKSVVIEN